MKRSITIAVRMCLLTMVVLGFAYPLTMTGVAALAFPSASRGSMITRSGALIGSRLIGQLFSSDKYFRSRPSAVGYDANASGASNLAPSSQRLGDEVAKRVATIRTDEGLPVLGAVPVDAATTSGSGLDPDISPEWALMQVARVARVRGLPEGDVRKLVEDHITGRQLGLFGEARVNVLELNLALDGAASTK